MFGKLSLPWLWKIVLGVYVAGLWLWDNKWGFLLGFVTMGALAHWLVH